MNIKNRFKRSFRLRFAILYPFGVWAMLFATPDDASIRSGIGFIITGLLIRVWANGYAIKLDKLTTSGPYALVRHPLYLGTMLLIIGFNIVLKTYHLIGILVTILIASIYYKTIRKEEAMLNDKFRQIYINYKSKVPMVLPTIFPYREGEKWPFSFKRLIKSQEYKLFIWIIVAVILFHLKEEFMVEREAMNARAWGLIIVAIILSSIDLAGEFVKHRIKSNRNIFLV